MNKREELEAEFTKLLNEFALESERLNKMYPQIGKLFTPDEDFEDKLKKYDKQVNKVNKINQRKREIIVESSRLPKTK